MTEVRKQRTEVRKQRTDRSMDLLVYQSVLCRLFPGSWLSVIDLWLIASSQKRVASGRTTKNLNPKP
jgi:hypothetical protein